MEKKKIVLIGAGSAMFTQGLVMDLIEHEWDVKWSLALCDIDPNILKPMERLVRKMLDQQHSDIELTASVDRCDVLPGADFVVSTIGVGGRRAWEQDVFIPRKYGIYQPVGDSVAPGGMSRSLRMIPALIAITEDIMRLCPNAYFFNYANPMTANCRAINKATGFPVVGLCHGVKNGQRRMAGYLGIDASKFQVYAAGLNHMVFAYDFRLDGKDARPLFDAKFAVDEAKPNSTFALALGPLSRELYHRYGVLPVSDDRHYSEFTSAYFGKGAYFGRTLGIESYSFEATIKGGDDIYDEVLALAASDQPLPDTFFSRLEGEHEELCNIIDCLMHDGRKAFYVNLPNRGVINGIADDTVVESLALCGGRGFIRTDCVDLSPALISIIAKHAMIDELIVEAALTGNRDCFIEAILQGGYLNDRDKIAQMADKMLEAQAEYLPQFKK